MSSLSDEAEAEEDEGAERGRPCASGRHTIDTGIRAPSYKGRAE